MRNAKPILITGSHRSGTTWIGKTIAQHPRVEYIHEPFNVDHPNKIAGLKLNTWFSHYQSSNQKTEISRAFNDILEQSALKRAIKIYRTRNASVGISMQFIRQLLIESISPKRILIKDPIALLSANWLYETYDFKVIVMIRNPLAFVGSLKTAGWDFDFEDLRKQKVLMQTWLSPFAGHIELMCAHREAYDLVDRAALLWNILHFVIKDYQLKYPEWLFVKHEEISIDPQSGFSRIFDHLGLGIDDKIKHYIENHTSHKNPTEARSPAYQPRNSRLSLQTWKSRLSDKEIERVMAATHSLSTIFYAEETAQAGQQ